MKQAIKSDLRREIVLKQMTPEQFAQLGDGLLAYIRPVRSEDVHHFFPDVPSIQPGMQLFALLSADGSPIVLTDSHDAAIANAWEYELDMVSVH